MGVSRPDDLLQRLVLIIMGLVQLAPLLCVLLFLGIIVLSEDARLECTEMLVNLRSTMQ